MAEPLPDSGEPGRPRGRARRRGYAYGPYHDGPDPLAPPVDLRAALDKIGRDVMEGSSLRQAVRELLDKALTAERAALARQDSEEARFAELDLETLPDNTARAVRALREYDWQSADGRQAYQDILDLLGREMLDQRFAGMKEAMQRATPADVQRIQQMLDDLNSLLAAHAAGQDTAEQFAEFMGKHGEYFPENPQTVDELVDLLAARSAAAQRMMQSLSPEQRAELAELSQQAFGDPRLGQSLGQLDSLLQNLRPGADWSGSGRFRGDSPMGLGEATRAMEELGRLEQLTDQLSQGYPGAQLDDIDLDDLEAVLGEQARADVQALAALERELRDQGVFERAPDGSLRLSPKALRRLGESALRDVVDKIGARRGDRATRRSGAAGEPTGASRPWAFGDTESWNVPRTLLNAQLRQAGSIDRAATTALDVTDVEIIETEQRTRAVVALCVDTSWSMVQDGRWVPMKRTALALHQLISTRFRTDALQLITFGRGAEKVELAELIGLEGAYVQGTNLHHALLLAGDHLHRHPDAVPVILVVTDGEPTAHVDADGQLAFAYPTQPDTLQATVTELDRLSARRAAITFFVLGDDPRLADFIDSLARRCHGRVVAPDLDGLGAEVVADYLRTRQ